MKRLRVLIVDDDRDFAEGLGLLLETRNCEVTRAFSGAEALQIIEEAQFDLTFLDVRMPGMNGIETLTAMLQRRPGARIVMMSGFAMAAA